jgi:prepilin peptidase CpaA
MALALVTFHVAIMAIAAAVFIAAAVSDAYTYRIPNYLCGLLILLFPVFVMTSPEDIDWHQNAGVFALVTILGFAMAMFLGHLAGAGDIKLLAAASLWAGPHFIAVLLIVTAFAGGIVSIIMAVLALAKQKTASTKTPLSKIAVPYGIAIGTGGLTVLALMAQPIFLPN